MTEVKPRSEMDPAYQWDLSSLYADDQAWEADLSKMDGLIGQAGTFHGRLHDAAGILAYFRWECEASRLTENLYCYASLRHNADTSEAKATQMLQRIMGKYVALTAAAAYATPEILANSEQQLQSFIADPALAEFSFRLQDLVRRKPHTLNAGEEGLLAGLGEALNASGEAANALMDTDMTFADAVDQAGGHHPVAQSTYILLQTSTDRTLRRSSFESYYRTYQQHIHTLAATYNGCVKGAVAEAKARGYGSSREMALSADNIPLAVYDSLIEAVHAHLADMYRYAALRKKILGLDELHYYDLYTPLSPAADQHYSYQQAQQMILEALQPMGEAYVGQVRKAFADRWIDVYPNQNKTSGAFSSGTYTSNPYILTNFTGTLDSVSTIIHEMGHSMHSWYTNHHQPIQYADYSLFVAEVASTVNENLLVEDRLKKEHDPERRLALLNQYLEGFKGTVFRQTMFAEFEQQAHAMAERGEPLDADSLDELYAGLIRQYFGDVLVFDDAVQYEWARIPHFYRPFYVFVYATGYSSAVALSQKILSEGPAAARRYREFLEMGGSRYPLDELRHAGVDLATPQPVNAALEKFRRVLDEAEEIVAHLN